MSTDENAIRALYASMIEGWNARSGEAFAAGYLKDSEAIGFDGSLHTSRDGMASDLQAIFEHHPTARYVTKVKSVRLLTPDVGVLRALTGLVPPGQSDIRPEVSAWQVIVAVKQGGEWRIAGLQNTPLEFHGRPELLEALNDELREELRRKG